MEVKKWIRYKMMKIKKKRRKLKMMKKMTENYLKLIILLPSHFKNIDSEEEAKPQELVKENSKE